MRIHTVIFHALFKVKSTQEVAANMEVIFFWGRKMPRSQDYRQAAAAELAAQHSQLFMHGKFNDNRHLKSIPQDIILSSQPPSSSSLGQNNSEVLVVSPALEAASQTAMQQLPLAHKICSRPPARSLESGLEIHLPGGACEGAVAAVAVVDHYRTGRVCEWHRRTIIQSFK